MSTHVRNVLSLTEVNKSFGDQVILDDLTYGLSEGEKCGLIGANGTGKSTLLKIMAKMEPPDSGQVASRSESVIAYLAQATDLPDGTVFEVLSECFSELTETIRAFEVAAEQGLDSMDALLGRIETLGGWDWQHLVERAASDLSLEPFLDRDCKLLSGGEAKRVALARLRLTNADIILLDEPTNHLDARTVEWLETWISESPKTFLIITHDRYFLDTAVSQIAELRQGKLHAYPGGYTDYLIARAEEEQQQQRTTHRTFRILKAQLEWASRSPSARRTKAKAKLKDIEERKVSHKKMIQEELTTEITFADPGRLGKTILELIAVTKGFDPERPLIKDLFYHVKKGTRIGILGANGSGKSTFLKLLTGELECDSGRISRGKNTRIAILDQHRTTLDPDARLKDIVSPKGGDTVFVGGKEKMHIVSYLERFGFPKSKHRLRVAQLSGGEKSRLALARFLLEDANVILLDEPTNDLDLPTIHTLEQALLAFPGCIISVSHDRYFLDRLATTIMAFEEDEDDLGKVTIIEGDYTTYTRIRGEELKRKKRPATRAAPKQKVAATPKPKPSKRLSYNERREFEGLEPAIEALEGQAEAIERRLADPNIWAEEAAVARELQAELETVQSDVEAKMARWEALTMQLEEDAPEGPRPA